MHLRELEVLEKVAANWKPNILLGDKGLTDPVTNGLQRCPEGWMAYGRRGFSSPQYIRLSR